MDLKVNTTEFCPNYGIEYEMKRLPGMRYGAGSRSSTRFRAWLGYTDAIGEQPRFGNRSQSHKQVEGPELGDLWRPSPPPARDTDA